MKYVMLLTILLAGCTGGPDKPEIGDIVQVADGTGLCGTFLGFTQGFNVVRDTKGIMHSVGWPAIVKVDKCDD